MVSKSTQVLLNGMNAASGTDFDNSEIAGRAKTGSLSTTVLLKGPLRSSMFVQGPTDHVNIRIQQTMDSGTPLSEALEPECRICMVYIILYHTTVPHYIIPYYNTPYYAERILIGEIILEICCSELPTRARAQLDADVADHRTAPERRTVALCTLGVVFVVSLE